MFIPRRLTAAWRISLSMASAGPHWIFTLPKRNGKAGQPSQSAPASTLPSLPYCRTKTRNLPIAGSMWMPLRCNRRHAHVYLEKSAGAGGGSSAVCMVRLPSSRGIGFLVRRRRSDEHAHVLDAAVAGLVEGEPGILVELLPPGGRSVLD